MKKNYISNPRGYYDVGLFEKYKLISSNIQLMIKKDEKTLAITSASAGEGKTTTAFNLAQALANSGKKVLLIDADLKKPSIHKKLNCKNDLGFSDLLLNNFEYKKVLCSYSIISNLTFLFAGTQLNEDIMNAYNTGLLKKLIMQLNSEFDLIIFDLPPILMFSDAQVICSVVDAVVIVTKENYTKRHLFEKMCNTLDLIGANTLGVINNCISNSNIGSDYY